MGIPGDVVTFAARALHPREPGAIDFVGIDSPNPEGAVFPAISWDNLAVQDAPMAPVATDFPPLAASSDVPDPAGIKARLRQLPDSTGDPGKPADAAVIGPWREEWETLLSEGPFAMAYGVTEGTPQNARIQLRGDPDRPGAKVPRGFLSAIGGGPLDEPIQGSGRLELARWLTGPTHPLTARVMVNRIWQFHFGRGLVTTPNDFGTRGQRPSHPELLDHLATRFIRGGWSIKAMHRLILMSATYRQAAGGTAKPCPTAGDGPSETCPIEASGIVAAAAGQAMPAPNASEDGVAFIEAPSADLFSPFPRRRLGAEEIRDAILLVSGALDPSPGKGHPFPAPTRWGYTQHAPFGAVYEHNRRSVYLMTQRIRRHPFLALFDGADPNASTPERRASTVPTQALYFLNDPFVHANAERFVDRVLAGGLGELSWIEAAYRLALARNPTPDERLDAVRFLAAYRAGTSSDGEDASRTAAFAAFARVLFGGNEFLTVD